MIYYNSEKNMPISEVSKGDGTVHHLSCNGSRRHVLHWDSHGEHCSEPLCEINNKSNHKISIKPETTVGNTLQNKLTIERTVKTY